MSDEVSPPGPAHISRRKLIVVGGFAVATGVVLRKMGSGGAASGGARAASSVKVTSEPAVAQVPTLAGADQTPPSGYVYERVIAGGRVIDPETGFDQVAHVGIDGDRIRSISTEPLQGTATIDATGLVVTAGFVDILSYEPNSTGVWFKVADGVTTNLGMHGINDTAQNFFETYGSEDQRPPVHYGGAFDDPHMRDVVAGLPSKPATASQISTLEAELEKGIAQGWIGVDVEPEYTPWVTTEEITALARVAQRYDLPLFSHIRYSTPGTPEEGSLAALDELLRVAEETGVAVHVDHITSMNTHVMNEAFAKLDDARGRGLDVTACLYPYDFWATTLASQRFAPGWQERFGIDYGDLEVAGTGERLTASTFARYQAQNKLVAAYAIPEADVRTALQVPWTIIGSDAILEPTGNNHPRATGCFARTLGRYARDESVLSLVDALAKMTILPARRLEARVPALRRKGRMQVGADADVTVFDPATVVDQSTVADPAQESVGIEYVLVAGELVKERATINKDLTPGRPITAEVS